MEENKSLYSTPPAESWPFIVWTLDWLRIFSEVFLSIRGNGLADDCSGFPKFRDSKAEEVHICPTSSLDSFSVRRILLHNENGDVCNRATDLDTNCRELRIFSTVSFPCDTKIYLFAPSESCSSRKLKLGEK